jgi:hypothetical protein
LSPLQRPAGLGCPNRPSSPHVPALRRDARPQRGEPALVWRGKGFACARWMSSDRQGDLPAEGRRPRSKPRSRWRRDAHPHLGTDWISRKVSRCRMRQEARRPVPASESIIRRHHQMDLKMERGFSSSEIIQCMREGAILRRRITSSQVTLTMVDGQSYPVRISMVDQLIDQHQINEESGGIYSLTWIDRC